mmetsp:Transcript_14111/g.30671  ORF Transcript_14111/g.30671 Transcript_14111/m.30671 type:complete len:92 (-) Transcript_14111:3913-4188(-)
MTLEMNMLIKNSSVKTPSLDRRNSLSLYCIDCFLFAMRPTVRGGFTDDDTTFLRNSVLIVTPHGLTDQINDLSARQIFSARGSGIHNLCVR